MKNQKISETVFYKKVIEELSKILIKEYELTNDDFHIIRIESPSTPGVPDINVCIVSKKLSNLGKEFWLETKYPKKLGLDFWIECKVYPGVLGSYQIAWKKKRELAGGRVFVITYMDRDVIGVDNEIFDLGLSTALKYILRKVGL